MRCQRPPLAQGVRRQGKGGKAVGPQPPAGAHLLRIGVPLQLVGRLGSTLEWLWVEHSRQRALGEATVRLVHGVKQEEAGREHAPPRALLLRHISPAARQKAAPRWLRGRLRPGRWACCSERRPREGGTLG